MSTQKLTDRVPIPAKTAMNGGLTSPLNSKVLRLLGQPTGKKTVSLVVTMDVGPFRATGLKPFLEQLKAMFAEVKEKRPDLYAAVKSAGCRVVRPQRFSNLISNHSWGIAIDCYAGTGVEPHGSPMTQRLLLELYPFVHKYKLYWGAEFRTNDAMHIEASGELLDEWDSEGKI